VLRSQAAVALLLVCSAAALACSSGGVNVGARDGSGDESLAVACGPCPSGQGTVIPYFVCDPESAPVLSLSGPCENVGSARTPDGVPVPVIGATGAGTCHATISLPDRAAYSTDIVFTGHPLSACCGEAFTADPDGWTIDNACQDAGPTEAGAAVASSETGE